MHVGIPNMPACLYGEGFRGVHAFVWVWLRANGLYGRCQRMAWVNSLTEFCFSLELWRYLMFVWQLHRGSSDVSVIGHVGLFCLFSGSQHGAGGREHLLLLINVRHTDGWLIKGEANSGLSLVHHEPPEQLQCFLAKILKNTETLVEGWTLCCQKTFPH